MLLREYVQRFQVPGFVNDFLSPFLRFFIPLNLKLVTRLLLHILGQVLLRPGEDSMLRRVHPKKRSVSWVNSVLRQFLPNGSSLTFISFLPRSSWLVWRWADMEVPKQSFNKSSWDSRTCYPRRAFNQGLTNNCRLASSFISLDIFS